MKALIISEDNSFINTFEQFFSQKGFSTIVYKWLLKALDNIEEIKPNCVILNSSEYPRHWKTLVQFLKSGIGGDKIAVFLYEAQSLSEEELSKAKVLGITSHIRDYNSSEELERLSKDIDSFFAINQTKNIEEKNSINSPFVLLCPKNKKIISGLCSKVDINKLKLINIEQINNFAKDERIQYFSYEKEDKIISTSAKIIELVNNSTEKTIVLELEE